MAAIQLPSMSKYDPSTDRWMDDGGAAGRPPQQAPLSPYQLPDRTPSPPSPDISRWEGEGGAPAREPPGTPRVQSSAGPGRGVGPPPGYEQPYRFGPLSTGQAPNGVAPMGQPGGQNVIPFDPRSTLPQFGPVIEGTLAGQYRPRGVLPNPYATGVAATMYPTPAAAQTLQPGQPGDPHAPARDAFSGVQPNPASLPPMLSPVNGGRFPDPLNIGQFFAGQAADMAARARQPMQSYAERAQQPWLSFGGGAQEAPMRAPPVTEMPIDNRVNPQGMLGPGAGLPHLPQLMMQPLGDAVRAARQPMQSYAERAQQPWLSFGGGAPTSAVPYAPANLPPAAASVAPSLGGMLSSLPTPNIPAPNLSWPNIPVPHLPGNPTLQMPNIHTQPMPEGPPQPYPGSLNIPMPYSGAPNIHPYGASSLGEFVSNLFRGAPVEVPAGAPSGAAYSPEKSTYAASPSSTAYNPGEGTPRQFQPSMLGRTMAGPSNWEAPGYYPSPSAGAPGTEGYRQEWNKIHPENQVLPPGSYIPPPPGQTDGQRWREWQQIMVNNALQGGAAPSGWVPPPGWTPPAHPNGPVYYLPGTSPQERGGAPAAAPGGAPAAAPGGVQGGAFVAPNTLQEAIASFVRRNGSISINQMEHLSAAFGHPAPPATLFLGSILNHIEEQFRQGMDAAQKEPDPVKKADMQRAAEKQRAEDSKPFINNSLNAFIGQQAWGGSQ